MYGLVVAGRRPFHQTRVPHWRGNISGILSRGQNSIGTPVHLPSLIWMNDQSILWLYFSLQNLWPGTLSWKAGWWKPGQKPTPLSVNAGLHWTAESCCTSLIPWWVCKPAIFFKTMKNLVIFSYEYRILTIQLTDAWIFFWVRQIYGEHFKAFIV